MRSKEVVGKQSSPYAAAKISPENARIRPSSPWAKCSTFPLGTPPLEVVQATPRARRCCVALPLILHSASAPRNEIRTPTQYRECALPHWGVCIRRASQFQTAVPTRGTLVENEGSFQMRLDRRSVTVEFFPHPYNANRTRIERCRPCISS